jgi:hypothetical protein
VTVEELIKKLESMPADAVVVIDMPSDRTDTGSDLEEISDAYLHGQNCWLTV